MRKAIIIASLAAIVGMSGCMGTHFRWEDARGLRVGMTKAEVVQILGKPYSITAREDGIVRYVWVEVNALTFASKSLSVDFREGKAITVPPIPEEFK